LPGTSKQLQQRLLRQHMLWWAKKQQELQSCGQRWTANAVLVLRWRRFFPVVVKVRVLPFPCVYDSCHPNCSLAFDLHVPAQIHMHGAQRVPVHA
jgi:hypothetical protein